MSVYHTPMTSRIQTISSPMIDATRSRSRSEAARRGGGGGLAQQPQQQPAHDDTAEWEDSLRRTRTSRSPPVRSVHPSTPGSTSGSAADGGDSGGVAAAPLSPPQWRPSSLPRSVLHPLTSAVAASEALLGAHQAARAQTTRKGGNLASGTAVRGADRVRWADEVEAQRHEREFEYDHEREHEREREHEHERSERRSSGSGAGGSVSEAVEESRRLAAMAPPTLQMELQQQLRREHDAAAAAAAEEAAVKRYEDAPATTPRINGLEMYRAQRELEQHSSPLSPPARSSPSSSHSTAQRGSSGSNVGASSLRISRPVSVGSVAIRRGASASASAASTPAHSAGTAATPVPASTHSHSARLNSTLPLPLVTPQSHRERTSFSSAKHAAPDRRPQAPSLHAPSLLSPPPPARPPRSAHVQALLDQYAPTGVGSRPRPSALSTTSSPPSHSPARSPRRQNPFQQSTSSVAAASSYSSPYPRSHSPARSPARSLAHSPTHSPAFSPARSRSASPVSFFGGAARDRLDLFAPSSSSSFSSSSYALARSVGTSERRSRSANASPTHPPRLALHFLEPFRPLSLGADAAHAPFSSPSAAVPTGSAGAGVMEGEGEEEEEAAPSVLVANMVDSFSSTAVQLSQAHQRVQQLSLSLSDHVAAHAALGGEVRALEFENQQLHECVRTRNEALVARDAAREEERARMQELQGQLVSTRMELAARPTRDEMDRMAELLDAESERASRAHQRAEELAREYEEKLAHLLALSQGELAAEAARAHETRLAQEQSMRLEKEALRARYDALAAQLAACVRERNSMKRTLGNIASSSSAERGQQTKDHSQPLSPAVARSPSASPSRGTVASAAAQDDSSIHLQKRLIFSLWHRASSARVVEESTWRARCEGALGRAMQAGRRAACREALRRWERALASLRSSDASTRLGQVSAGHLRALVARRRFSGQASAFLRWRMGVRTARRHKLQVLARALAHAGRLAMLRAMRLWRLGAERARGADLHGALVQQKQSNVRALVQRWRAPALVASFAQWRHRARSIRSHRTLVLERLSRGLDRRMVTTALRRWSSFLASSNESLLRAEILAQKQARIRALTSRARVVGQVSCFLSWRRQARQMRSRKIEVLERMSRRAEAFRVRDALRQWRSSALNAAQASQQSLERSRASTDRSKRLALLLERSVLRSLTPCFHHWVRWARGTRERRRELWEKISDRLERRTMGTAWNRWGSFVHRTREARFRTALLLAGEEVAAQKRARVGALIQQWRLSSVMPAFLAWGSHARAARQRKRELLGRVVARLSNLQLSSSWRTWRTFTQQSAVVALQSNFVAHAAALHASVVAQKRARAAALIQQWRLKGQTPFFLGWRAHARQTRIRKRELLSKILSRLERTTVSHALSHWRRAAESIKEHQLRTELLLHKRARIGAAIVAWRVRCIVPAFLAWRTWAGEQRRLKRILLRNIVAKMESSALHRAMLQWRLHNDRESARAWAAQMERAHAHLGEQLQAQRRKRYQAMLARWEPKSPQKVMRAWALWTRARRDHVQALETLWRLRRAGPVFAAWRLHAREQCSRKRILVARVVARLAHARLYASFGHWTAHTRHAALAEMEGRFRAHTEGLEAQVVAQKRARAGALIQQWRLSTATPAFLSWRSFARAARKRKCELLGRVVARLSNLQLYSAWRAWSSFVQQSAVVALQSDFAARAAALHATVVAQKRARAAALIQQWRLKGQTPFFLGWRAHATQVRLRKRELLGRVVARLVHSQLDSSWRTWTTFVQHSAVAALQTRFAERTAHLETVVAAQKRARVAQLLQSWRHRSLAPAMLAWRDCARVQRTRKRDMLDRVCMGAMRRVALQALHQWARGVEQTKRADLRALLNDSKARRAIALIQHSKQASCAPVLAAWAAHARAQKGARVAREERRRALLDTALRRLDRQQTAAALRTWLGWVGAQREGEERARVAAARSARCDAADRMLARWGSLRARAAFLAWRTSARASRLELRRVAEARCAALARVDARLEYGVLARSWRSWVDFVVTHRAHLAAQQAQMLQDESQSLQAENGELRGQLQEQIEIVAYLYRVVQHSV